MKIIKRISVLLMILALFISNIAFIHNSKLFAANISVSGVPDSVNSGGNFTITVTINGGGSGMFYFSASNATLSTNSLYCDGQGSVNVTAGSSGAITITVSAGTPGTQNEVTDLDGNVIPFSPYSKTVTINTPSGGNSSNGGSTSGGGSSSSGNNSSSGGSNSGNTTNTPTDTPTEEPKSSNNNLSGLSVSTGTLSPEFNADTTEYTVTLPADATTISIDASAADEKATVSGTGEQSLKAGLNEFIINVTAENGDAKNYYVRVNVDETPLVYTTFKDQKLGVVRNTDEIGIPNSFEETTVTLDGQEVKAWNSTQMNKTIVFLVNDAGEKNFYLFENNQVTSIFKPVGLFGRNLYIIDVPTEKQKMKGFTFGEVVIKDEKFGGWTFDDEAFANYSVIYVMDELGNIKYYQYEKTEDTLQLYSLAAPTTQEAVDKTNEKVNTQQMIIYALIAATLVGGGLAAYAFYRLVQSKKNDGYNKKFDYTNDDE